MELQAAFLLLFLPVPELPPVRAFHSLAAGKLRAFPVPSFRDLAELPDAYPRMAYLHWMGLRG